MRCKFELERRKDKDGNVALIDMPIRFVITFKGERVTFFSGYRIDADKWDGVKQRTESANRKGVAPEIINKRLADMENVISQYELHCAANRETPEKDELKERMAVAIGKGTKQSTSPIEAKTFLNIFDTFVKESGTENSWSISTHKKFAVVRNHLNEFTNELNFELFNEKGLSAYLTFLREKKKMRNTSVSKHLKFLKWFLRWATVNGYNTNTAFQSFKPKLKSSEKKVIFLTWDELMTVYNFDIPESKEYLARVRDVFCFTCFTSLRYSDAHNLKRSDIKGDVLDITTVKTSDHLTIELNKYSRAILSKYEGSPFAQNKALPVISNQKMNDYLKELGEMCGINEPQTVTYYVGSKRVDEVYPKYELLGTHTGRRTFICNALALGIPVQVVMKWTGHKDYKAMKPYIDVADEIKFKEMNKFNEL